MQVKSSSPMVPMADKLKSDAGSVAPVSQAVVETARQDSLNLSGRLEKIGKGSVSMLAGAGTGAVLGTVVTSGLASFAVPHASKHAGAIVHGSLRLSLASGLAGAAASTLLAGNTASGTVIGALAGALTNMHDTLGGARMTIMISGAAGAVAGGIGGYTAAKVKQQLQE